MTEEKTIDSFEQSILDYYGDNSMDKYTKEEIQMMEDSVRVPSIGKVYESTIVGEDSDSFLLRCGFKDLVRVPKNREETNFFKTKSAGDEINVLILGITDSGEYSIDGSVASIYREEAFEVLRNIKDDEYVQVHVDELTNAGYNCTIFINGCEIDAFLPQILAGVNKIHDDAKNDLIGKNLNMCIESFANDKGTWIVSRRKYLKQLIPQYIEQLDQDIVYEGHVTGTTKFGVFVEFFDCLTGMIHRTNLNKELSDSFSDIKDGDTIQFYVKEVIKNNKIILTQVKTESLWDTIEIGQKLTGTVKEHKNFGTLIILDHETLGLIHTSQQTPKVESLQPGDEIEVKILAMDRGKRKIFLSQK